LFQGKYNILHIAARHGAPNELIQFLVDAGVDVKAINKVGQTPAGVARSVGRVPTATFLDSFIPSEKTANRVV
jgi:hypothetical protein